MCGRYTQTKAEAILRKRFRFDPPDVTLAPRFNVAPTQDAPVVLSEGRRVLRLLRWGFPGGLFNARAETVGERPAFRDAFRRRRCLVLADGFYEWRKDGKRKTPVRFVRKDREAFAFAGLHEGGAFTILTTVPNALVSLVHDRMPVMLLDEAEEAWLDEATPSARLRELLAPYPEGAMDSYDVSSRVGDARLDDPSLVEPAAPPPPPAQLSLF